MLENKDYLVIPKDNVLSRTETITGKWKGDNTVKIEIEYLYSFGNDYKDYDLEQIVKENEKLKHEWDFKEKRESLFYNCHINFL